MKNKLEFDMFKNIILLFTITLLLTIKTVEAQICHSSGLKFGFQKYTYKTYEIEHNNKSFLFSKRPEDNLLFNFHWNRYFKNHIVIIPSFDIYRSSEKMKIIPNLDFAYYEYKSYKFLCFYGLGLGLNNINNILENNHLKLNVNTFFALSLQLNNQISLITEVRFFPLVIGGNIDDSPFQCLAGISYQVKENISVNNQNKPAKSFFYSIVGLATLSRIICLIYQANMPWS